MMALLSFGNQQRTGEGFKPRHCVICKELITQIAAPNQTSHPGSCRAEQKRRYLAKVAEDGRKRRNAEKLRNPSKIETK